MLYFPNIQSYTIEDQNKRTKDPPHFRSIEREREHIHDKSTTRNGTTIHD